MNKTYLSNSISIILILFSLVLTSVCTYGNTIENSEEIKSNAYFVDKRIEELIVKGDFRKAFEYCTLTIEQHEKSIDMLDWYRTAAYLESRLGEYEQALWWGTSALSMAEEYGVCRKIYADILNELATYNSRISNYDEAIRLCNKALLMYEDMEGAKVSHAISLNNLSHYMYKKGNIREALKLCQQAEIIISQDTPQSINYINVLQNMARYKSRLGQYTEAVQFCEKAEGLLLSKFEESHPDHAILLSDMATYWSRLGEYIKAKEIEERAIKIRYVKMGEMHPNYAVSLNRLAHYNYKLGNYQEAVALCLNCRKIQEQILTKNHLDYISNLNDLSKYYAALDSIDKAIQISIQIKELYQQYYSTDNTDYANVLSNLASYYDLKGECDNALNLEETVLKIRENKLSSTHPDYAKSMALIALYKSRKGEFESAIDYGQKALTIQKNTLGMQHPDVLNSLINLTYFNFTLGNYTAGEKFAQLTTEIYINKLRNSFQCLIAQERKTLWDKNRNWFSDLLPKFVNHHASEFMRSLGYDAILFSKGILQNSVIEFSRFLNNTQDENLINKFEAIRSMRMALNKQYEKAICDRNVNTDSLENLISNIEKELINSSKKYGDYTRNLSVSWRKVQENLKNNDLAIEFLRVPITTDSIIYVAYVLRADMNVPELVKLFSEKQLEIIERSSKKATKTSLKKIFKNVELTNLIWGKLRTYIDISDDIYFAADGKLHQIGIEYFINFDGNGMLADEHSFHRLSSTRQIVVTQENREFETGKLFGGIIYDVLSSEKLDRSLYSMEYSNNIEPYESNEDRGIERLGVEFLKNTGIEVDNIKALLLSKNIHAIVLSGIDATEESVKSMSGNAPDIIHIATHGFVWQKNEADKEAELNKNLIFLSQTNENAPKYEETKVLNRAALIMAGANYTLSGFSIPEGIEDGILTAAEIAQLDLSGSNLIVLSACQSGLGEINNDGVYGLQRGFKMAGANSILMSLWKVDDVATQMLMTCFYRNLIDGQSKQQALLSAQKSVKEFEGEMDVTLISLIRIFGLLLFFLML